MKKTPLYNRHLELGAKMLPFAGYEMPIQYAGIQVEHHSVRNVAGLFDVSHMGEFIVEGAEALELVQYVSSNDAARLTPGRVQYSCLPNAEGGIVDDLLVYCLTADRYMLVVNAANHTKDWEWIKSQNTFDAQLIDRSDEMALLAVQGPASEKILQQLTSMDLSIVKYYHFVIGSIGAAQDIVISATGYTGERGFELYCANEDAVELWDAIMEAGAEAGLQPVGLAARDTLRLEKGFALYGNDIDDSTSPYAANLGWIVKLNKNLATKEILQQQKIDGVAEQLVGFELLDRGIARKDYELLNSGGEVIGRVTSGTMSPTLGRAIGMGYVKKEFSGVGTDIWIQIRKKQAAARIVALPFVK